MRVLHLLTTNKFSGAENVVCQIVKLFENEIEMAYCSPDGDIRETINKKNIEFIPLKIFSINEINRAIKEYKPDIIHTHDIYATVLSSLAFSRVKKISHIHANHTQMNRLSKHSLSFLLASLFFKKLLFVSSSAYDEYYFKKLIKRKSEIIKNVINMEEVLQRALEAKMKDVYDIVYIGRMSEQKNPIRMVEILKKVIEKNPDIQCALMGDGPLFDDLQFRINEYGLQDNIHMLGFINNPFGILSKAKVFLMTSKYEGTPMVALEAQTLGKPIVSTPVDGLLDIIINDENGFLSNDDNELVEVLIKIVKEDKYQKKLEENSRKVSIRINDCKEYKERLLKLYKEVLEWK